MTKTADELCECGHIKARHTIGAGACGAVGCGCLRHFTPVTRPPVADDVVEKARVYCQWQSQFDIGNGINQVARFAAEHAADQVRASVRLQTILEHFYAQEQNVELSSFWDGGWTVRFGDKTNGYTRTETGFDSLDQVAEFFAAELSEEKGNG